MSQELSGKVAVITGGSRGIGRAIAMSLAARGAQTVLAAKSEANLKKTAAEIAAAGTTAASASLARYEHRLARALAHVINILDPHAIVLGGGLSRIAQLYRRVPERWKEYVFSERDSIATRLLPPKYGDSSGVRGAAWLWPESA